MLEIETKTISNGRGWELSLKRTWSPAKLRRAWRPLLLVPGFAMNSYIFGYHPTGLSMEAYFAEEGFEVWSVDMSNQGRAVRRGGSRKVSLQDLALHDLHLTLNEIAASTLTEQEVIDVVGASLGGTILFVHMALSSDNRVGSMVAMGSPLRWIDVLPALRSLTTFPSLAALLPAKNTRLLASLLYPVLLHVPKIIKIYLHPEIVSTEHLDQMLPTVDDPNPRLNVQIAKWIKHGDLVLGGINIHQALARIRNPLLCVVANADGIVLPKTARSGLDAVSSEIRDELPVGDETLRFAHADLFISNYAQELVFAPISSWLQARYPT